MKFYRFLLVFCLLTGSFYINLYAKNYYISNAGDDNANGLSPSTSFQTIAKLNDIRIKPGDTIFFKSGDYYTGTLILKHSGKDNQPVVITSYGNGAKPVISGSMLLGQFKKTDENIYSASCIKKIHYLFQNNHLKTKARYPNTGYLKIDGGGTDFLDDFDLPLSEKQIEGATVRLRTKNWQYEYRKVTGLDGKSITFDSILWNRPDKQNEAEKGWGYFLDGSKAFLDAEGEWCYSSEKQTVYLYTENPVLPDDKFEASFIPYGIVLEKGASNISIQNICISGQTNTCILGKENNQNIQISDCNISKAGKYALLIKNGNSILFQNNMVHDILGNGIKLMETSNSKINDNTIKRIGTIAGYGIDGVNGAIGVSIVNIEKSYDDVNKLSHANSIQNNYIDSTGYSAIRMDGHHNICENNIIKNGMFTLNDGGLVYCWGFDTTYTYNNIIRGNIIINAVGNADESTPSDHLINQGIYLDARSRDFVIEKNIIKHTNTAILLNDQTFRNTVQHNICYDNKSAMAFSEWKRPHSNYGNTCINNLFVTLSPYHHTLSVGNHRDTVIDPGIIDKNKHISLIEKFHIHFVKVEDHRKLIQNLTLEGWKKLTPYSEQSTFFNPTKHNPKYPLSKIFINETNDQQHIELDDQFDYIDADGNVLDKAIVLNSRKAKVVFYKKKTKINSTDSLNSHKILKSKRMEAQKGYIVNENNNKTKRYCMTLDLKDDPELIKEYKYWHENENIWPEIPRGIKEVGIVNMEIYLYDTRMFMIMETTLDFDFDKDMARLGTLERQGEWEKFVGKFQKSLPGTPEGSKWQLMERVYKLE